MHYLRSCSSLWDMDDFTLRYARPEDLDVLLSFEQALISAERPFDECIREDPVSYYDIKSIISDPDIAVVVALYQSDIVASGYCRPRKARSYLDHEYYAYLGFMYTLPNYRGRGINQRIIDYLSDWATEKGLSELRLTVYQDNTPAIKAYEKVGFKKHIVEMRVRNS